jgi:hypothetical protein
MKTRLQHPKAIFSGIGGGLKRLTRRAFGATAAPYPSKFGVVFAALACVMFAHPSAFGQALPPATGTYDMYDQFGNGTGNQTGIMTSTARSFVSPEYPGESTAAISLNFTTQPSVSASGVDIDAGGEAVNAVASLTYDFTVEYTGNQTPAPSVQLDITGNLNVGGTEPGEAYVNVSAPDYGDFGSAILFEDGTDPFDLQGQAYVGRLYNVYIAASAQAGDARDLETSSASVDPLITINGAGLADPSDYQVVFSSNLTPATVPDGGMTIALVGGALAIMAACRRRFVG